jgi:hypothetical protein
MAPSATTSGIFRPGLEVRQVSLSCREEAGVACNQSVFLTGVSINIVASDAKV